MRTIRIFFALLFVSLSATAQTTHAQDGPAITFEKKAHDFGDVVQGEKVEHTFYFTNTGNAPLIITNVQVTCGCTTPKGWPRDPIAPGGKGELTVGFATSGKSGRQHKPITVVSNAINKDGARVSITANILPPGGSQ